MNIALFFFPPLVFHITLMAAVIFGDVSFLNHQTYPEYIPENFRIVGTEEHNKHKVVEIGILTYYSTIFFSIYYSLGFWVTFFYNCYFSDNHLHHRKRIATLLLNKSLHDFFEADNYNSIENKAFIKGRATGFSFRTISVFATIFGFSAYLFLDSIEYTSNWDIFEFVVSLPHIISFVPLFLPLIFLPSIVRYTSWLND